MKIHVQVTKETCVEIDVEDPENVTEEDLDEALDYAEACDDWQSSCDVL